MTYCSGYVNRVPCKTSVFGISWLLCIPITYGVLLRYQLHHKPMPGQLLKDVDIRRNNSIVALTGCEAMLTCKGHGYIRVHVDRVVHFQGRGSTPMTVEAISAIWERAGGQWARDFFNQQQNIVGDETVSLYAYYLSNFRFLSSAVSMDEVRQGEKQSISKRPFYDFRLSLK